VVLVPPAGRLPIDLDILDAELAKGARVLAITGASNVTGALMPLQEIHAKARHHGIPVLLDAAQIAGWLPIDVANVHAMAVAGHKGLRGPWGIGLLYVRPGLDLNSPATTCELPFDGSAPTCTNLPGYCDVGSVNQRALHGLAVAMTGLDEAALTSRLTATRSRVAQLQAGLAHLPGVRILGPLDPAQRLPTVAWTVEGHTSGPLAARMLAHGVRLGSGLQCAPLAHQALGTQDDGCLRASVSPDTTHAEIEQTLSTLTQLLEDRKH
jgi:selenocysteine lyase/cysteine desulfurase